VKNKYLFVGLTMVSLLAACDASNSQSSLFYSSVYDGPTIIFKANIPIDVATSSNVVIAGNFNSWNPLEGNNILTEIDAYNYQITIEFDATLVGTTLEYKYVLLLEDQTEGPWTNVEGSTTGGEIGNRTYTLREGMQTVNDTIASFKNNTGQTTLSRGTLRKVVLDMPLYTDGRRRTIRIWLPDGYQDADTSTRYPVLYMHDGQNLFDAYTGFAGEWGIDETIGALMDLGYGGSIVVGIDNSSDRLNELSPSWPRSSAGSAYIKNPSGEKYASFIVDVVKPYLDANFNTNPSRETTGIGGSSMGGVMSFFMALQYPDVFGYGMLFSTAMYVYEANMSETFIASKNVSATFNPRLYIYAGGQEPTITRYVDDIKNALIDVGYLSSHINTHIDPNRGHNEAAWAHYFPIAYRWLVNF